MPKFKGVTKAVQARYERCVEKVKKQNKLAKRKHRKTYNPYAVCYASVVGPKRKRPVHRKGGKRTRYRR
jgi:hypothetical protein